MEFLEFMEWPEGYELLRVIYNIVMSVLAVGLLYLRLLLKRPKNNEKTLFDELQDKFMLIDVKEELEYELKLSKDDEIHSRAITAKIEAINSELNLNSHPPDD